MPINLPGVKLYNLDDVPPTNVSNKNDPAETSENFRVGVIANKSIDEIELLDEKVFYKERRGKIKHISDLSDEIEEPEFILYNVDENKEIKVVAKDKTAKEIEGKDIRLRGRNEKGKKIKEVFQHKDISIIPVDDEKYKQITQICFQRFQQLEKLYESKEASKAKRKETLRSKKNISDITQFEKKRLRKAEEKILKELGGKKERAKEKMREEEIIIEDRLKQERAEKKDEFLLGKTRTHIKIHKKKKKKRKRKAEADVKDTFHHPKRKKLPQKPRPSHETRNNPPQ